jgi:hypothetical protein
VLIHQYNDMTVTPNTLFRATGVAAAVAGLIFIGVQIGSPHLDGATITTTNAVVRDSLKVFMAALALAGISGMYLLQVKQIGVVGYLVFATGYLTIVGIEFVGAFVLPSIAHSSPAYVSNAIAAATNGTVTGSAKGKLMWFTTNNGVGHMGAGGAYTTFSSPSGDGSYGLCLAPDGHIWSNELTSIARWVSAS